MSKNIDTGAINQTTVDVKFFVQLNRVPQQYDNPIYWGDLNEYGYDSLEEARVRYDNTVEWRESNEGLRIIRRETVVREEIVSI